MSDTYREQCLRHKYEPIPEKATYRKKTKRKAPKKANHRHEYANCLIVARDIDGSERDFLKSYCTVCGKVAEAREDDLTREYGINPHFFSWYGLVVTFRYTKPGFLDEARRVYNTYHFNGDIGDVKSIDLGSWE